VGRLAGLRRAGRQAVLADDYDAKAVDRLAIHFDVEGAGLVGIDSPFRPRSATINRAPKLNAGEPLGAHGLHIVVEAETSGVRQSWALAAGRFHGLGRSRRRH